jgi:hypothetical protein
MNFTWDEKKRKINLTKHGFDFVDAEKVFDSITLMLADERLEYSEERYITIGMLHGELVVISHTEKDDETRIISMRKATKHEQKTYFENF